MTLTRPSPGNPECRQHATKWNTKSVTEKSRHFFDFSIINMSPAAVPKYAATWCMLSIHPPTVPVFRVSYPNKRERVKGAEVRTDEAAYRRQSDM